MLWPGGKGSDFTSRLRRFSIGAMMPKRWLGVPGNGGEGALSAGEARRLSERCEHHYWDFIDDYSIQRAIAFLSPRGEGAFEVLFPFEIPPDRVRAGDMAIVYGMPTGQAGDRVILDGAARLAAQAQRYRFPHSSDAIAMKELVETSAKR